MTRAERSCAIAHILAECHGNYSVGVVIETTLRLRYSLSEIGSRSLIRAMDAANRQPKQKEAA